MPFVAVPIVAVPIVPALFGLEVAEAVLTGAVESGLRVVGRALLGPGPGRHPSADHALGGPTFGGVVRTGGASRASASGAGTRRDVGEGDGSTRRSRRRGATTGTSGPPAGALGGTGGVGAGGVGT
ncbi:hypothetical protein [Actinopolymorpha pittospori]|uniref:Uncharacterized protein n=1 Tax=Actinopolymorpha pittospori TaxID=648752 RepID=A0A927RP70_9ACTN|nr:hypothetical protein [Actinopolymorpha pittospori]MBE1611836.1 hypothetical protein [Actinopolymorpha pittospori]